MPKEELAWVPKSVPVKEAGERTLRVAVVMTRSPVMNLLVEGMEEEDDEMETDDDWVAEDEPASPADELEGEETADDNELEMEDEEEAGRATVSSSTSRVPAET